MRLVVAVVDDDELAVRRALLAGHGRGDHAGRGRDDRVPKSSERLKSTERALGLWLARVVPVHTSPQGNGISEGVTGCAVGLFEVSELVCTTSPV